MSYLFNKIFRSVASGIVVDGDDVKKGTIYLYSTGEGISLINTQEGIYISGSLAGGGVSQSTLENTGTLVTEWKDTISGDLITTGANLEEQIGAINGVSQSTLENTGSLVTEWKDILSGNLITTGASLEESIGTNSANITSNDNDIANLTGTLDISGANLEEQIGLRALSADTGDFFSHTESGIFATSQHLIESGSNLEQQIGLRALSVDTGDFLSKTESGVFATSQHLIETGSNLEEQVGLRALSADTGNFLSKAETGVFATSSHLIESGSNLEEQVGLRALSSETGDFVSNTQTGIFLVGETKSITIEDPKNPDKIPLFRTPIDRTLQSINSVVYWTGSNPSVTFRITQDTERDGTAGLIYGDRIETNITTGFNSIIFDNANITGGNFVFVEIVSGLSLGVSGNLHITLGL